MTTIRHANLVDIDAILRITNNEILNNTAFWMNTPRTLNEQKEWFKNKQSQNLPVLVAVDSEQQVMGYASYGSFRNFEGFKQTVEHSVYVDPSIRGKGIGRQLLQAIVDHAKHNDFHVMVAGITAGNMPSIRLHESVGFKTAGILPEVGQKFDEWLDLLFMYKILSISLP